MRINRRVWIYHCEKKKCIQLHANRDYRDLFSFGIDNIAIVVRKHVKSDMSVRVQVVHDKKSLLLICPCSSVSCLFKCWQNFLFPSQALAIASKSDWDGENMFVFFIFHRSQTSFDVYKNKNPPYFLHYEHEIYKQHISVFAGATTDKFIDGFSFFL